MTFEHEYDLQALKLIQPQGQQFQMHVTPRFSWHYEKNEYEAYTACLLAKMCERASIFIDVGAHYGFFSLLAAKRNPHLRVIAAEPVHQNFQVLKRNVEFNKLKNIQPLNLAISDRKGSKSLHISAASDNCGFYIHPATESLRTQKVRTTTIDALLASAQTGPIVVKIDTEGHELSVFEGMKETLKRFSDIALFVEFNPEMIEVGGGKPADLLQRLDDLGFSIFCLDDAKQHHFRILPHADWSAFVNRNSYANLVCLPKQRALNVVFFSHLSNLGGAERALLELVDEWLTDHWTLATVVCPEEGPLAERFRAIGAAVAIVPFDWWCQLGQIAPDSDMRMAQSVRSIVRQLPLFRNIGPDLIWTQTIVIPWGAMLAALLRKPHIWSICEYGEQDHQLTFYLPFPEVLRTIELSSNFIFTSSPALLRALFPEQDPERTDFIYCPVRIPNRKGLKHTSSAWTKSGATRIAVFGTLQSGKGQEDIIRAVGELASRGQPIELILAGYAENTHLDRLNALTQELNIESRVTFTGLIGDPYPTMATADIVVSCARQEAFGLSLVEAMLLERAVVYAGAGGPLDYMIDGKTGLSYPPGDTKKLADQLDKLIGNPTLRKKLGRQACAQAEKLFPREGYGEKAYKRAIELRDQPARLLSTLGGMSKEIFTALELLSPLLCADTPESSSRPNDTGAELAVARSRIKELEKAVEDWSNQAKGLEHGIEVWSTQAAALETERAKAWTQNEKLEAALKARSSEAEKLAGDLLSAQSRVRELEKGVDVWSTQAAALETARATASAQNEKLEAALKARSSEAEKLAGDLLSAQSRVRELEKGVEVWSKQVAALETERATALAQNEKLETTLKVRSGEAEKLSGDLLSAQSRVRELEKGVDVWSTQAAALEVERAAARAQIVELESTLKVSWIDAANRIKELNSAHAKITMLEKNVTDSSTEIARLLAELGSTQGVVSELEVALDAKSNEVGCLKTELIASETHIEASSTEIARLRVELVSAQNSARELTVELNERLADITRFRSELVSAQTHSALLARTQEAYEHEIRALKASVSWRLSKPLRLLSARLPWISRFVRKLRRNTV